MTLSVERLLEALGIEAQRRGTKLLARCPNPAHDDQHPSWMIRDDPGEKWHGSHNCRSCGLSGGPWELVAAVRGVTLEEAARICRELAGGRQALPRDVPDLKVRLSRARRYELPPGVVVPGRDGRWNATALAYLRRRDVTEEQAERWGLGYATTGPLAWRVVVPVWTRGALRAYVARALFDDGSRRYDMPTRRDGARPDMAVWGEPGWGSGDVVVVCEGVFGGMALERAGAPAVGAICGSELTAGKILVLGDRPPDLPRRRLIVATDPDAAGDKAALAIEKQMGRRCEVQRLRLDSSPDDYLGDSIRELGALLASAVG